MFIRSVRVLTLAFACAACSQQPGKPPQPKAASTTVHPVTIVTPASLRGAHTGEVDAMGNPVVVPCATCHAQRDAGALPQVTDALRGPHAGFTLAHGDNTCGHCHDPEQRDRLRLADGTSIELVDAMRLCAQCHGTQKRDYDHGAHGGMRGYWDTSRGPRERNHCVSCHDPHRPKYPQLIPAPPPRDRMWPTGDAHD